MSCVLQGLLFKVDGVSTTAPVYAFLSAGMLTLCVGFLTWWLAVVVVRIARQLPWSRMWLHRMGVSGRGGRGKQDVAPQVLFTAHVPSPSRGATSPTSVGGTWRLGADSENAVDDSAPICSHGDKMRDRASAAPYGYHSSSGGSTGTARLVPASFDFESDARLPERGSDELGFATTNPLRAKRSGGGVRSGLASGAPQPSPLARHDSDSEALPSTDRGARVMRARLSSQQ